jgi:hypothetical protein
VIRNRALRLSISALAGLAVTTVVTASPASASRAAPASATPSASTSVSTALEQAFEAGQHLPGSAVGGIQAGTLHMGTASGQQWAIASFMPADPATQKMANAFQDGGATGVFTQTGGLWHLVRTGLYGCGDGLPAALKSSWNLGYATSCTASAASQQRTAAQQALASLPASAKTAATPRGGKPATGGRAATAAPAASASPADLGQRIAAIALSKVGLSTTPAVNSFNGTDCNPFSTLVAGFSADSDGCGYDTTFNVPNENETWCADFAKWVWQQAGVTADMNTLNAGSVSFNAWGSDQGETMAPNTGAPQPGDAIIFFAPGRESISTNHVGLVSSVNPDGTINMVNGDFLGSTGVTVEYDTNLDLTTWAPSIWGPGTQWAIVSPPTTPQQPTPTGVLSAPKVAVAGSTGSFHASGTIPGGSITNYYWTFGDGRTTNATGPDVTHAFSEAGTYPVTVTITSSLGTIATLEQNVQVLAPSSAVASVPDDGIWYDPLPVMQYTFTRSAGGLAVDSWDGGGWLQDTVPGAVAATGTITALSYPDTANADAMTPHAYYRASDGSLAETYQSTSGWVTQELPGKPAAGGAIVATTTTSGGPAVFFVDTAGNLAETAQGPGGWTTSELLHGGPAISAPSLTLADTTSGTEILAVGPDGTIRLFSSDSGNWSARGLPAQTTADASLAAVTTPGGAPAVFYVNADGGSLAEATRASGRSWIVTNLPGTPDAKAGLAATTYLLPSMIPATQGDFPNPPGSLTDSNAASPLGTEAFYLTASGAPGVTYNDGSSWHTATLPAVSGATAITGATAYQLEEQPSDLFLSGPGGLTEETTWARSGDPSDPWTTLTLPDAPATWADHVVLYAADPSDAAAAQAAAAAAGLPASQVTTSFATAWADTLSGEYLVLAVGGPAVRALYSNPCGWANPSGLPGGGTPFYYYLGPINYQLEADAYVNAASDTAADTQALATDLAYYALNGTLPAGVTSLPAAVGPPAGCAGSAS